MAISSNLDLINNIGLNNLEAGELAIFCGAGISIDSGIPKAQDITTCILNKTKIDKEKKTINETEFSSINQKNYTDFEKITRSYIPFESFMEVIDENTNIDPIFDIYKAGNFNNNHYLIACLVKAGKVKTIVTTNFDQHLENAFNHPDLNLDYKVYYDENSFSEIDYDNQTNIIKIHGCVNYPKSIRTTMKSIAQKTSSEKRRDVIEQIFKYGLHKKVLILGYSCSDTDLVPQIHDIKDSNKEIIFIKYKKNDDYILNTIKNVSKTVKNKGYYSNEINDYINIINEEDLKILRILKAFEDYNGYLIECELKNFVNSLGNCYGFNLSSGELISYESTLNRCVDAWAERISENGIDYLLVGKMFERISNFNKAIKYYSKTLKVNQYNNNIPGIAACYGNLGVIYDAIGNYNIAKKYHIKNLDVKLIMNDQLGISRCYINLGIVDHHLGDFNEAIKYYYKALKILTEIEDKTELGSCYFSLGNSYRRLDKYDRALKCYEESIKISNELGYIEGICYGYNSLGNIYGDMGYYYKAFEYHQKSLEIAKEIRNEYAISACYASIGNEHLKLGDYNNAQKCYEKSIEIARKINAKEIFNVCDANLSIIYSNQGNKKATDYLEKDLIGFNKINQTYSTEILKNNKRTLKVKLLYNSALKQLKLLKKFK